MISLLVYDAEYMHKKNKEALHSYKNINIEYTKNDITKIDKYYDAIYSPVSSYDVNTLPECVKNKTIYIFGPHFSVFPEEHDMKKIQHTHTIYIQPSNWASDVWKNHANMKPNINIQTLPFGVNTERFKPIKPIHERTEIFIYYKHRHPDEIHYIFEYFEKMNLHIRAHDELTDINNNTIRVFNYTTGYDEEDYLYILKNARCGIWIDAHESQGFALEEALSCDVPLIVWNIHTMNQELNSTYDALPATTIPYWNETCGEVFYTKDQFEETFKTFIEKNTTYRPREFILENLSQEKCEKRLIDLIHTHQNNMST